jgi:hypothetical protein
VLGRGGNAAAAEEAEGGAARLAKLVETLQQLSRLCASDKRVDTTQRLAAALLSAGRAAEAAATWRSLLEAPHGDDGGGGVTVGVI